MSEETNTAEVQPEAQTEQPQVANDNVEQAPTEPAQEQVEQPSNDIDATNVFGLSDQGITDAKETYQQEQAQAKEEANQAKYTPVDLSKCNFDDPNNEDGALSQNGRYKSFVADCKREIEYLRENATTPEKYEFTPNAEIEKGEFTLDTNSPMYSQFKDIAKKSGMSQNQFDEVANLYLASLNNQSKELNNSNKENAQAVISELGRTPIEGMMQIRSLSSQITELNVPKDQQVALQDAIGKDSNAIKGLQHIMKSIGYKKVEIDHTPRDLKAEHSAVKELMSSPEYNSDPNYKKMVIGKLSNITKEAVKYGVSLN